MNRTIKFRGKRIDNGEWVYGDLLKPHTGTRIVSYDESEPQPSVCRADFHYHNVDPATVGQFTGVLDKNGLEIYEGDIISLRDYISEVRWNSNLSAFCIRFSFESELEIKPLGSWIDRRRRCNVIGNIHDSPELLNEK
ncbi:MAG: YopX family protein [Paramuribaculum sp.]|nr:YopX family protein [Paramuribaculum sp.]